MSQTATKTKTPAPTVVLQNNQFLKQRSILVIDDEHGIRNFLIKGLSKHVGLVESAEDIIKAE